MPSTRTQKMKKMIIVISVQIITEKILAERYLPMSWWIRVRR